MPYGMRMDEATHRLVRTVALALDGVEEAPYFGLPAFKLNGHLLACPTSHASAEMNTLLVPMSFEDREVLLEADPDLYYLKPHYENYAVILIRVSPKRRRALEGLLREVWERLKQQKPRRAAPRRRSAARRRR